MIFIGKQNILPIKKGAEFGVDRSKMYKRNGYVHEGDDYVGNKRTPIKVELSGVVSFNNYHVDYGNMVQIKTDLIKYFPEGFKNLKINIESGLIYSMYCHLYESFMKLNQFVKFGEVVGSMGNSGNCWTRIGGEWRPITKKEQEDETFKGGVHLHFGFFTYDKNLANYIIECTKNNFEGIALAFQWGKYFINPRLVFDFLNNS
jgi:murein DD-endopeptidase MepM/ murein hydrolase activator NlpD